MNFEFLEKRYGEWKMTKTYCFNHFMPEFGDQAYLNIIYIGNNLKHIKRIFKTNNVFLSKSIIEFYSKFNGLSLFAHSIKLYGYQPFRVDDQMPLDFEKTNYLKKSRFAFLNNKYFIIGSYSNFFFCLKEHDKTGEIYIVDYNSGNTVKTFKDLNLLLGYCIPKIAELYDKNGIYIHKKLNSTFWLDNAATENIF